MHGWRLQPPVLASCVSARAALAKLPWVRARAEVPEVPGPARARPHRRRGTPTRFDETRAVGEVRVEVVQIEERAETLPRVHHGGAEALEVTRRHGVRALNEATPVKVVEVRSVPKAA